MRYVGGVIKFICLEYLAQNHCGLCPFHFNFRCNDLLVCPGLWRNPLAPCMPSGYPACCRLCEGLLHRVQLISSVSQAPITVYRNEGIVLPATQDDGSMN